MPHRHPCLSICLLVVLLFSSLGPAPVRTPPALAAPARAPAASEILLSQGKPASASSSYCDPDTDQCLMPGAANDGDPATFWQATNQWWTDPPGDTTYPQWWQVDLGAVYTISRLDTFWLCFFELGCPAYRYTIDLSADGTNFTTVVDRRDNTTDWQTSDSFRASGRFVRITITGYDPNGLIPPYQIAGAFEFLLYGSAGPLALEISDARGEEVEALGLNPDGWPTLNAESGMAANPITVTLTLTNTTATARAYDARLFFGSPDDKARFYIFSQGCLGFDQFSYTVADDACGAWLEPDETTTLEWGLWVQPSLAATLVVSTEVRLVADHSLVDSKQVELEIPQAQIHPLVLIHGILGAMPPHNELVTSHERAREVFDPFIGSYWPILDQFEKLGYEWNSTLFAQAYDWRQSNDRSADFLAAHLRIVEQNASEVSYVAQDNGQIKADLVVHSMGGLLSRAYIQGANYQGDVRKIIFSATPHQGFPFDYRTWEGMTWSAYLYNAPGSSGGALGVLARLMDERVWPTLAGKKYAPAVSELQAECIPSPVNTDAILGTTFFPVATHVLVAGYTCSNSTIAQWSHAIDESDSNPSLNRGVRSLYEMLPVDDWSPPSDLPNAYLYRGDGLGGTETFPFGHQRNRYLEDLNDNIDLLAQRLGLDNIYVLYGDNAPTDMQYKVTASLDPHLWRYGVPIWSDGGEDGVKQHQRGDDLIPMSSSTLGIGSGKSGLLPIDETHERGIVDTQRRPARHKEILRHPEYQTEWVPRFLGIIDGTAQLPFQGDYTAPLATANVLNMFSVISACPINLLITDPLGRRLGYDPATGQVVREIPNAVYTSPGLEPQIIVIANPLPGEYQITATGYGTGAYSFNVDQTDSAGLRPLALFAGQTTAGQINQYTLTYTPTASFPATPIRDDFNRADGALSGTWAGDVREYEIQNQALRPSGGNGAIYWDAAFGPDQEAYVTLSASNANAEEIDLLLKGQGEGQCEVLEVWYQPRRGTAQVWTCHNFGAWTQHGPDIPIIFQAGDQFGARAKADGTVEVYKNGTLVGSVTLDSSWPYRAGGGRIGLWTIQAGAASLDSFGGGSLP